MRFNNFMLSIKRDIENEIKFLANLESLSGFSKADRVVNFILEKFENTTNKKLTPLVRFFFRLLAGTFVEKIYATLQKAKLV